MSTAGNNNYNHNPFERSKGASYIMREVVGSLAQEAVRAFANTHNTAYRVDAPMVLQEVAKAHTEAADQLPAEAAVSTQEAPSNTAQQDAARRASELALSKDDYELIA